MERCCGMDVSLLMTLFALFIFFEYLVASIFSQNYLNELCLFIPRDFELSVYII